MEQELDFSFDEADIFLSLTGEKNNNLIERINIKKEINSYLEKLDTNLKENYFKCLSVIICFIKYRLHLSDDDLVSQLKMNNSRNILGLINLLLPYVDDKNNFYNFKNFSSIDDLVNSSIDTNDDSINPYKFCNYSFDHNRLRNEIGNNENNGRVIYNESIYTNWKSNDDYIYTMTYLIINSIEMTSYKLYVNWINVFPIGVNFQESKLFQNSWQYQVNDLIMFDDSPFCWNRIITSKNEKIEKEFIDRYIKKYQVNIKVDDYYECSSKKMLDYGGLNAEDVYNTFVNDYYFSIKKNKWLLFEFMQNNEIKIFIHILNSIFNLKDIYLKNNWEQLNINDQIEYINIWKKFLNSIKSKKSYESYSYEIISKFFVTTISRFFSNYKYIKKLIKEKQLNSIDKNKLVDDEIEYSKKGLEYIDEYILAINNLDFEYIFDFLYISVNELLNSPYKHMFIYKNKIVEIELDQPEDGIVITPKNFYNFGKALTYSNYSDDIDSENIKANRLSFLWEGLNNQQRDLFCLRINTFESKQDWFKITKILKKIHNLSSSEANMRNMLIYKFIRENIINLTFKNLTTKGVLSEFRYNPNLSDEKIITDDYNKKREMLDKNMRKYSLSNGDIKYYNENCYYYATGDLYGKLNDFHTPDNETYSYLEHLREVKKREDTWYTFYAMDWLCQIDFFMKFVNQRVLYITGSTGQGKSTQVPKLTLYGLKAFYYKDSGKAICTQPRINATVENVSNISKSMGIPIVDYNKKLNENIRTLNGVIQYKHASDSHIDANANYFLRMVTDGTLLGDMERSPTLKKTKVHEDDLDYDPILTNENIYDVIMVDEAHEHNANMDIILTLARNTLLYNNDIKLLIISATMEEDEPIYRNYYRYINDNLSYPISLSKLELGINKNYIDRRFHISPPGKTTQHVVNDHFTESSQDTYEDNEKLGIAKVQEIFTSTSDGDILFFSTTRTKLIKICRELNSKIPLNCICLPYFAFPNMPKKYFDIVTKIAKSIKEIDIDKSDLVDVFIGEKKEETAKKVKKGTYSRTVIIATSVAEASLTISSLRFVVDLGFVLTPEYDYEKKISTPSEIKITDSSRVQRRGRVGRVAGGDVYYMYPKDSRKYIKGKYNISTDNFSNTFIRLLSLNETKQMEIIDVEKLCKMITFQPLNENNLNDYEKKIYDQYKLNGNINYDYKKDYSARYLIQFIKWLLPSYKTGISQHSLYDTSGHFYLIHPLEGKFIRDIKTRNIINKNTLERDFIKISDSEVMIETALLNLDIIKLDNVIKKSDLCVRTDDFSQKLKIYDRSSTKPLVTSYLLDILDVFNFCNICIEKSDGKIESFIDVENIGNGKVKSYKKFISDNSKKSSDIELFVSIYNVLNKLINYDEFDELLNNSDDNKEEIIKLFQNKNMSYEKIIDKCKEYKLSLNDIDKLIQLKLKGSFDNKSLNEVKFENIDKDLINQFIKKIPNLDLYINNMNLNSSLIYEIILDFLNKRKSFTNKFEKYNKLKEDYSEVMNISYKNLTDVQKITLSYLIGNLDKLVSYKEGELSSINGFNLLNRNRLVHKKSIRDYFGIDLTFLENLNPVILSLKLDSGMDGAIKHGMLFNIEKEMLLKYVSHLVIIYERLDNDFINKSDYIKNIDFILEKINKNDGEQNKILNLFYRSMTKKVTQLIDQQGGRFPFANIPLISHIQTPYNSNFPVNPFVRNNSYLNIKTNPIQKTKIETLKKIPILYNKIDDKLKADIDKFDYAYVHLHVQFPKIGILGIHLVKEAEKNVLLDHLVICSPFNLNNSLDIVAQHLHYKGNTLVIKIDMNLMLDSSQQKILDIILK